MIESKDNEKLKLVRKLRDRRKREREGLFATEGEDLLEAGLAAGVEPRFVLVAAGAGIPDGDLSVDVVEEDLLAAASALGSGTRMIAVWPLVWGPAAPVGPCVYLHGVGDPGNVGTIIRTADALLGATVVLGPGCADPFGPKATRAEHGLDLRPAAGPCRGRRDPGPAGGARRPRRRGARLPGRRRHALPRRRAGGAPR